MHHTQGRPGRRARSQGCLKGLQTRDIWTAKSHVRREPLLQAMVRWQKCTRKAVSRVPLIQDAGFDSITQEICVGRGG